MPMRRTALLSILTAAILSTFALAQNDTSSAVCTYTDGNQISLRYTQAKASKEPLPMGKVWSPGSVRMDLFTETSLTIGSATIQPGAYSFYFIPEKDSWTFVVNKNVTAGSAYDQQQDVARGKMQTEKLGESEPELNIYFGHLAPKKCAMRVDYGKVRAVGDIDQK